MIIPEILMVENYRTMNSLGLVDTVVAIGAVSAPVRAELHARRDQMRMALARAVPVTAKIRQRPGPAQ
jgi:hypothetical protein